MRSRTTLLALFSTFICFADDRFERWLSDPRLVRSMRQQTAGVEASANEALWALYWYQQWPQHPQATAHLCAYLQEPCYWAAERVARRFVSTHYALSDGFQVAITHLDRILDRYSPAYGSSLKTYARTAFDNCIRDQLRQQQTVNICSDWGLLRKLSRKQLREALLAAGLTQVEPFVLTWKCFNAVCIPDPSRPVRSLSTPTDTQLTQIADRYNQLRTQLSPVPASADVKQISIVLKQIVEAVRAYLTPAITSLQQKEETGEPLLDLKGPTPLSLLIAKENYVEQQRRQQQIGQVLLDAIAQLDPPSQKLLKLYYQRDLTQKDIAQQLKIKQYQVSRKLSRVRQILLLSIAKWSQETLHISPDPTVLATVSDTIHEWLTQHYAPLDTFNQTPTNATTEKNS